MVLTFFFAQFLGLMLIVLSISLLQQKRMYRTMLAEFRENRTAFYPLGFVGLILGLVLVLLHNVWSGGFLPFLVTLLSWVILIKSIAFFVLPPAVYWRFTKPFTSTLAYRNAAIGLLIVGIYLSLVGSGGM